MVGFDIDNRFYSSSASSNLFEKKRSLSKRLRKSATTSGGVLAGRTIAGACSRFFLVSSFCPHRKKIIPEYQLNIQLGEVESSILSDRFLAVHAL